MARRGSFGGGTNPLRSGTLSSFAGYDIGDPTKDPTAAAAANRRTTADALRDYRADVAYANGEMGDDEYLANLRARLGRAKTEEDRVQIENKIHDTEYSIGAARAEAGGLDAVIAFEQQTLAGMDAGNYRAVSLRRTLQSHLAERRGRDYSNLVSRYNDGEISTETLAAWVQNTLSGLSPGAPDFDNWTGTLHDLGETIKSERDAAVQQDYQYGRMKPDSYLAYLTGRRDEYNPASPTWDKWNRTVEDQATAIAKDKVEAADSAFFDAYKAGLKSDASYSLYLTRRIAGMAPDDPDRPGFEKALNDATFSLAEDKLRYIASKAKTDGAQKAALGDLLDFYTAYRATLNPGSKTWRDADLQVDSIRRQLGTAGGDGGGTGGVGGGTGGGQAPTAGLAVPKLLLGHRDNAAATVKILSTTMNALAGAGVKTVARNVGEGILAGNLNRARRALALPDEYGQDAGGNVSRYFLYIDPRNPAAVTNAIDEATGRPILDAKGNHVKVQGSYYLPATDDIYASLLLVKAEFNARRATVLWGQGKDWTDAANRSDTALAAMEKVSRTASGTAHLGAALKLIAPDSPLSLENRIRAAEISGDAEGAIGLSLLGDEIIQSVLDDPNAAYVTPSLAATLGAAQDRIAGSSLAANGLVDLDRTTVEYLDGSGRRVRSTLGSALGTGAGGTPGSAAAASDAILRGSFAITDTVMAPGVIHTVNGLDGGLTRDGKPNWGHVMLDVGEVPAGATAAQAAEITAAAARAAGYRPIVTMRGTEKVATWTGIVASTYTPAGTADPTDIGKPGGPLLRIAIRDEDGNAGSITYPVARLLPDGALTETTFVDGNGRLYTAYSLDGFRTYARSAAGSAPVLEWKGFLTSHTQTSANGEATTYYTAADGTVVFTSTPEMVSTWRNGAIQSDPTGNDTIEPAADFFGGREASSYLDWLGRGNAPVALVWDQRTGKYVRTWTTARWTTATGETATTTYGEAGANGILNMSPMQGTVVDDGAGVSPGWLENFLRTARAREFGYTVIGGPPTETPMGRADRLETTGIVRPGMAPVAASRASVSASLAFSTQQVARRRGRFGEDTTAGPTSSAVVGIAPASMVPIPGVVPKPPPFVLGGASNAPALAKRGVTKGPIPSPVARNDARKNPLPVVRPKPPVFVVGRATRAPAIAKKAVAKTKRATGATVANRVIAS